MVLWDNCPPYFCSAGFLNKSHYSLSQRPVSLFIGLWCGKQCERDSVTFPGATLYGGRAGGREVLGVREAHDVAGHLDF